MECRALTTMKELALVQELDMKIWGMDPVPLHQTSTAIKNGGLMLGMFDGEQLIGFSYSFAGMKEGKTYLCSHMLGIDPDYQSQGLGEIMKWKQREHAIDMGYDLMKWTYDPLETKNAKLNLSKLNGICDIYIENCYGNMTDKLNKGLPSDRFEIHWHLKSKHVAEKQSIAVEDAVMLNKIYINDENLPVFQALENIATDADMYAMVVPKQFQALKLIDHKLAFDWRLKTREYFQKMFAKGFAVFHLEVQDDESIYYLVKKLRLQLEGEEE